MEHNNLQQIRMSDDQRRRIGWVILVLSGKGGVGKSTVAVNCAVALAESGRRVGLLDLDFHGPSVPTMLGLESERIETGEDGLIPVDAEGVKVMSLGFMLNNNDDAVIWRGPMKMSAIRQLVTETKWGDLDVMVVDLPPGTGDEPLSICQVLGAVDGALVVTTPQHVATVDVRKSVTFCRKLDVPVLGIVENMSGFACPHCGTITSIFKEGGGRSIAEDMNVPFLGAIPMDPAVAEAGDAGYAIVRDDSAPAAESMRKIVKAIADLPDPPEANDRETVSTPEKGLDMRIAIPLVNGQISMHFGHCEQFALVDVDPDAKRITSMMNTPPPPHEPGLLPKWLAEQGVTLVIAGGMGGRAKGLFADKGIEVVVGAQSSLPEEVVVAYMNDELETGENICDH